jgi:hypothetical protein
VTEVVVLTGTVKLAPPPWELSWHAPPVTVPNVTPEGTLEIAIIDGDTYLCVPLPVTLIDTVVDWPGAIGVGD